MLTRIIRQGRNQKGFTLIELLVVVAIIALLTAFAVPKIFDAISNARGARGQSDMDTITGALDRFYFEDEVFPADGTVSTAGTAAAQATDIKTSLYNGFLKQTTTFVNGHKRGYLYLTNTAGEGYVLIDPKKEGTVTIDCGDFEHTFTVAEGSAFQVWVAPAADAPGPPIVHGLPKAEFAACTITNPADATLTSFTTN